jgi:preprotein translocase subunit Sss1
MYSFNKTPDFTRLCNKFRTSLLSYLKQEFLRILTYPNNKKYKLSESELKCITEEEKNKITERSLLLKNQKELTEPEKVERENAVKRRLDEQRAFIIKSDYDETISKLKNYSKRIVIPSYKEWVQIVKNANIEKPNFKQWLLDQNKITEFDASFMEKIENITREYNSNPKKLRYSRAPTLEEWIKINEDAERLSKPPPIFDDEWLTNYTIWRYKTANPTPGEKTNERTFGKTRRRTKKP